jgi:hypothetical protein
MLDRSFNVAFANCAACQLSQPARGCSRGNRFDLIARFLDQCVASNAIKEIIKDQEQFARTNRRANTVNAPATINHSDKSGKGDTKPCIASANTYPRG